MHKRFIALARVSSREQEREGFSLDVQEDALKRYTACEKGEIVKFYRIAETASKHSERKIFKEMLAYARRNAHKVDGLLFYKVDRAARNIFDYVELERLEVEYELPIIYVSQPTENTPAGRMQRRILSNMASFYTEQQSLDVKEGLARRVQSGLFVNKAPYGYQNVRIEGRSIVKVHPENGPTIRKIFELYAYQNHTLDSLTRALIEEGVCYTQAQHRFPRSQLHAILRDRSYIGELSYHGQWYPGKHEPLIDRSTFNRVQVLLGEKTYNAHQSVYGSGMITCGHCGRPVVVEIKTKQTQKGLREYRYYRCAKYNGKNHPSIRLNESALEEQALALFDRMKIQDKKIHDWVIKVLLAKTKQAQQTNKDRLADLQRQLVIVKGQKDRLLNLRLLEEIDSETFTAKQMELRDREADFDLKIQGQGRQQSEYAELAVKVFELSQGLKEKWLTADIPEKRQILEIICLNLTLDGVSLVPEMRKPFDILAEGPILATSRGDWI